MCRIWNTEIFRNFKQTPLHSPKVSLVCIHSHIHPETLLFQRCYPQWLCDMHCDGLEVPKHSQKFCCTLSATSLVSCIDSITFMQYGTPPYIGLSFLVKLHNNIVHQIIQQFPR